MKLFIASLATETNTFSPMPTSLKSFHVTRGGDYSAYPPFKDSVLALWHKMGNARGWDVTESICALAEPAGKTLKAVYEFFRNEILHDLEVAGKVDAVLLDLHGAMVADGYDDCEGDLIAAVRRVVGPDVPIGVELDLHCHISDTMIAQATAIISYKEYPHTDFAARAIELFNLIADTVEGKVKPTMAAYDCRMVALYYPTQEPTRSFVDKLYALEGSDGILSLSLGHGFPWGDVPDLGTKMIAITDNDMTQAEELAQALGREFYAMREQVLPRYYSIDEAIDYALGVTGGPVVLADVSDNAGGGAPSDSTYVLKRLLERGITDVAIGCFYDPIAVGVAMDAGEGARLELRVGGKLGRMSGDPLDLTVDILGISPDAVQYFGPEDNRQTVPLGSSVGIRTNGIDIVLISERTQTFSPEVFTNVGIDPTQKKIVIVKSTQHFHARFAPIAVEVGYIGAPGAVAPNFKAIPFERVDRALWPVVDNPFET
jgi:microcystin degradation protein MlrC